MSLGVQALSSQAWGRGFVTVPDLDVLRAGGLKVEASRPLVSKTTAPQHPYLTRKSSMNPGSIQLASHDESKVRKG